MTHQTHPLSSMLQTRLPQLGLQPRSLPLSGASATDVALSALAGVPPQATPKPQHSYHEERKNLSDAISQLERIIDFFQKAKNPSHAASYQSLICSTLNIFIRSSTCSKDLLKGIATGSGTNVEGFQFTGENFSLVFDIKTHLGKPLIEELLTQYQKRCALVSSIIDIQTFIEAFETPNIPLDQLMLLLKQTSPDFQQAFKAQNCEKALSTPSQRATIIEFTSRYIGRQIDILRSETFNQISINPRQVGEDQLSYDFQVKINQIRELQRLLSGCSYEEFVTFFEGMDRDVKGALCEIIWVIDGKPLGNPQYGEDAIRSNRFALLQIKNGHGQNIIEQLERLYIIKRGILPELHIAQKIHGLLSKEGALKEEDRRECLELIGASEPIRSFCEQRIWERDRHRAGQESNPDFGGWEYGKRTIIENPRTVLDGVLPAFIDELRQVSTANVHDILESLVTPSSDVNTLAGKVAAAAVKSVALISCEFKGILSQGGLGEAVLGMAKGLQHMGTRVTMILPKYDVIPQSTKLEQLAFRINGCAVYRCNVNDIECLLIENDLFHVGTKGEKANSIYGGADVPNGHEPHVKARFAKFQNLATDLGKKLYDERTVDLLHVQDSQTALVPRLLEKYYKDAWQKGKTPPVVFTFHNNLHGSQGRYGTSDELPSMSAIGLGHRPTNSFTEGLQYADAVTTVSGRFAMEAQSNGELGRDVGFAVRKAALQGKLFDVLNGTSLSVDFDPKQNKVLQNWQLVESLDLPPGAETVQPTLTIDPSEDLPSAKEKCEQFFKEIGDAVKAGKSVTVDLRYGLDDHPLYIYAKKRICKAQVAMFMEKYGHGRINPDQPLLLNIGRFDSFQKGIGKIPYIMEKAKEYGAQLISIGLDGESCKDIPVIRKTCNKHSNNGLILIEDERVPGGIKWQVGHTDDRSGKKVPGIGPVLRAAADMGVFPSSFEPCGLVQGECFNFGCRVLATDTGGFHDTVFSSGDKANGWLFPRLEAWDSDAQLQAIDEPLKRAVQSLSSELYLDTSDGDEAKWQLIQGFHTQSKKIMAEAKCAGWADIPTDRTLNPAQKLQHVYARAIENAQKRGTYHLDLLQKIS